MGPSINTVGWDQIRSESEAGVYVGRIRDHGASPIHDHVFHEIVYVEAGTAAHLTAGAPLRLRPGDLIVIRPQVWHGYQQPGNLSIINCLFDKRLLQQFWSVLGRGVGALLFLRRPSRRARGEPPTVLHLRPAQRPMLLERLERMMAEQRERSNGWQGAIAAALLDVLIVTARLSRQQLRDQPVRLAARTDQAVMDTVSYLEAGYATSIGLCELAQRAHLSPAHLSRSFSRRMGMGIVEFVHQLRCEEACRLLRWSGEPIGRIATRVGYDEIAYFSRCFRRQIGQSPRQYARSCRGDAVRR